MKTMNQATDGITERFQRMMEETKAANNRLQEFAKDQPQSKICKPHDELRTIDWERSQRESWTEGKPTIIYRDCPKCQLFATAINEATWLKAHGVPDNLLHCSFKTFNRHTERDESTLECSREFCAKGRGFLILLGDVGLGKSHIAVSILREFGRGMFITNNQIMDRLSAQYNRLHRPGSDVVTECKAAKVLVLDELGISRGGRDELPTLHGILEHRHSAKLPTVVTANMEADALKAHIGHRMTDRLREATFRVVQFVGPSKRSEMQSKYFE